MSYKTVLIRRHQYSLVVNETTGRRITYSDIPNGQLCQVVNEVLQMLGKPISLVLFSSHCNAKDVITYA